MKNIRHPVHVTEPMSAKRLAELRVDPWPSTQECLDEIDRLMLEVENLKAQLSQKTGSKVTVFLRDFSTSPGPRFGRDGEKSGEEWGRTVLVPAHRWATAIGSALVVDLSGVRGVGYGFLHEAFYLLGHVRSLSDDLAPVVVKCDEEPELEVEAYEAFAQGLDPSHRSSSNE